MVMSEFTGRFSFPTDIVFGPGVRHAAVGEMAARGSHALLVTDRGLRASGLADEFCALLTGVGMACTIFDGVTPNPTEDDARAGVEAYRECGADLVVGMGGGSPLDVAKLVALLVHHPEPLSRYDDLKGGDRFITEAIPPIIAVPTTSGTGSEVSRSAVVTLGDAGCKTVIFSPRLLPVLAVCDPELTLRLPPALTAATGADALTHAIEAYLARGFHPLADGIALQAVGYVFRYLRRAVRDSADLEARSAMMLASTMGAVAFQKGLGACHSMAHPLSNVHRLHHGTANAICLPAVVSFNGHAAGERIRELARAAGLADAGTMPLGGLLEKFVDDVRSLLHDIGMPVSLHEAGVAAPNFKRLVHEAMRDGCHRNNPREMSTAAFERLFREVA